MNRVYGLVVCAGLSVRMGKFKPLLRYGDIAVIRRTLTSLFEGGVGRVILVIGYRAADIIDELSDYKYTNLIEKVYNPNFQSRDMLYSYKLGLECCRGCSAVVLLPGDMPAVEPSTIANLIREYEMSDYEIVYPSDGHRRLHPTVIGAELIEYILNCEKQGGLNGILKEVTEKIGYLIVDDQGCKLDLDTLEDYEKFKNIGE